MAEEKFYWIKLRTDFFAENTPIDFLLSQKPNGSEYVALYIKLCLATANTNGRLCNVFGELIVPYDVEKITADMKYFSIDTVRIALELYKKLGLIYQEDNGVLAITNHEKMVGSETKWAQYKRSERIGKSVGHELENVQQRLEIRDKEIRDKDIRDKEKKRLDDSKERKRFTKPTIDEIETYIYEHEYNVDAQRFFDYYESNGWKVGRNPMKDWKACVRTWNSKDKPKKEKQQESIIDSWLKA